MISIYSNYLLKKLNISVKEVSKNEKLLKEYIKLSIEKEGVAYPYSYINEQGKCYVFTKNNKIIGGYCLIMKPPFRVIEFVKQVDTEHEKTLSGINEKRCIEAGGLWMEPSSNNVLLGNLLWANIYKNIMKTGKQDIIFGYCNERKGLTRHYSKIRPKNLFRGTVDSSKESIKTHSNISAEYTTRTNFIIGSYRIAFERLVIRNKKNRGVIKYQKKLNTEVL